MDPDRSDVDSFSLLGVKSIVAQERSMDDI